MEPSVSVPMAQRAQVGGKRRASRIATHLWILFVLLPVILGLLYALLTAR
jgi:hypothetical protein